MECLPVGPIEVLHGSLLVHACLAEMFRPVVQDETIERIAGALKGVVVSLSIALGNFQQSIVDEAVPALAVLVACEDTVYATLNGAMRSMPHGLISGTVYHMMFERRLGYDDRKCVANMEAFLKDPGLPGVVL